MITIEQLHFTWVTYFCMVALVTIWNLGFTAITRKGKLLYFILEYFTRKKTVEVPAKTFEGDVIDQEIEHLIKDTPWLKDQISIVKNWLQYGMGKHQEFFSKYGAEHILANIKNGVANDWYYKKEKDVFPDLIKDPLVVCITCMASVHGFILYTIHCILLHHPWNLIEQIAISVPVAFLGEFLWKLKLKIEK